MDAPESTGSAQESVVTGAVIAQTRKDACRCEDEKHMASLAPHVRDYLHDGMPVSRLREMGPGCTTGRWVCPRLEKVRRVYGR